jgi:hypothetical protein
VIYFTPKKIIFAADSRQMEFLHGQPLPPDDCMCRIASLNGQVIFVTSGASGYKHAPDVTDDPVPEWRNIDEARQAYAEVSKRFGTAIGHTEDVAREWSRIVADRFDYLNTVHPALLTQALQMGNGAIAIAAFAGSDAKGELTLFRATILAPEPVQPSLTLFSRHVIFDVAPAPCEPTHYCGIGETSIFMEFVSQTSHRAKDEARAWKPPKNSRPEDLDIIKTMRLVELTIKLFGQDVGGKIDAVQMNHEGKVRWFARKKNCPAS